jgi:hypothetical protein
MDHLVESQLGKAINTADAKALTEAAAQIRAVICC